MTTGPGVVGAVLAGGRSSRFGRDKALVSVAGRPMMAVVVEAMRDAGIDPVMAIGGTAGEAVGVPTVADNYPGSGPLGGVATALFWAKRGHTLVAPCDLPCLRPEHLALLLAALDELSDRGGCGESASADQTAVVATLGGRPAHQLALWPAAWWPVLRRAIEAGERRFGHLLAVGPWVSVEVPAEAVSDADDEDELKRILGG